MLAGVAFTVFLAAFLACFLVVFAAALAAGFESVGADGAGAGVWAKVNGRLASPRAMVKMVVFIVFFSLAGLFARLQFHTALCARETR